MTVQVSDRLSQLYVGNGVNTRFDFTFRAFEQEDETGIGVRVKVGNGFEFIDESEYAVTLNPDNLGGYVTFVEPPSAATFFYIAGKTPVDQLLDITNYDNFYPDAIERALDKLTAILQEWKHLVDFETQARILADIDYDELAKQREADLKAYIDGIASAITGQPVLGLPSKFVVDGNENQEQINFYNKTKIAEILEKSKNTNKQRINISNFGNTGTITIGSTEAWDNALAYAKSIAPLITNNIGQSWFDLSGFEFVADNAVYLNSQLKIRSTYGASIKFNIVLADNFISTSSFAIDTSIRTNPDNALNRRPLQTSIYGNINCRYKGNGIYLNDFLHFTLHGNLFNYFSRGVETGTLGNEFLLMPQATVGQWQYTAGAAADLPPNITSGIGIVVNCGDCIILGIVAYYFTIGIRVNARSCFIGAGAHVYGNRKQALQQTTSGGNLLLDGVWFDASRVELNAEAQMRSCRVFLSSGDSTIGVIINGGEEVSVVGNIFLGISSGTTAVYRDAVAVSNPKCIVDGNTYLDGITNSDIRSLGLNVAGSTTVGTCTITEQSGYYIYDGVHVEFDILISWENHTGTGELVITGLPLQPNPNHDVPVSVMTTTSSLASVTAAYVKASSLGVRFKSGATSTAVTANGALRIHGRYRSM